MELFISASNAYQIIDYIRTLLCIYFMQRRLVYILMLN